MLPTDPVMQGKILDILATLILLSTILLVGRKRLRASIRTYSLQSFLLALLTLTIALFTGATHLYYAALLTLTIKAFLIPNVLLRIVDELQVKREVETTVSIPFSLLTASGLVVLAYLVSSPLVGLGELLTGHCLPISVSMILIGLFIMATRERALTQVIGLVTMENGVFLSAISITYGMPLIVEFGIFFDLLIGVVIMGIFFFRSRRGLDTAPFEETD
jgi:hydrogenase-4 component E